jgi:hypothetical protein
MFLLNLMCCLFAVYLLLICSSFSGLFFKGPKAAILSRKQDFAASAEDPKKLARTKGSKLASEAGFCCSPTISGANQKAGAPRRPLHVHCIKFSHLRNSE